IQDLPSSNGDTRVVSPHGRFGWYELATTDLAAAKAFYTKVMGWGIWDASSPGRPYILFTDGEASVAGLMILSPDAREAGMRPGLPGQCGGRGGGRTRRTGEAPGRRRARPADECRQRQPLCDLLRPASRKARLVQMAATRPAARRGGCPGPGRLARIARRPLRTGFRFLQRAVRLAESGIREQRGRHVSAVLGRRRNHWRHDDKA